MSASHRESRLRYARSTSPGPSRLAAAALRSRGAGGELSEPSVHHAEPAGAGAERSGRGAGRRSVRVARTPGSRRVSPIRAGLSQRLGEPGKGVAAQVLPPGLRRAPVRPHPGYREGNRLARLAHGAQLRRDGVAPADPVRAPEADERGHGNRPAGANCGAPEASSRAGHRDRARADRRHRAARRHGAEGSFPAVHADRT